MPTTGVQLSVLMPAYNEGPHLYENIAETLRALEALERSHEIVVIDDGSTDDTLAEARRAAEQWPCVRVHRTEHQLGKGGALREGFAHTTGDLVVFLDSDLDLHPRQLTVFLDAMRDTGADVVIGSKRHPESVLSYPAHRRFVSFVYFLLVRLMFRLPIHDTQTGLKTFRRDVLARVFPQMLVKKYAFDLELLVLAHRCGYTIREAPVVIDFRPPIAAGLQTAFRWEHIWTTWWDTMAVFYRLYILRHYDRQASPTGEGDAP